MLKKRLIGVVTVKNGIAVQSFGYSRYLPLGKPECLVENLDRWGADEILIQVIDRSAGNFGPDFELLQKLGEIGLETPLIYSGGIRSVSDAVKSIQLGADRIIVDSLIHLDLSLIKEISEKLGAQALIAALPMSLKNNKLIWLDYKSNDEKLLTDEVLELITQGVVSETLVIDWKHEGYSNSFENKLAEYFPLKDKSIIVFGGIDNCNQLKSLLNVSNVSAVAIGNFLSYKEHAIQNYKKTLIDLPVRPPIYESLLSAHAKSND